MLPYEDPELLDHLYNEERMTTIQMGEALNVSDRTIRIHMEKNGIELRDKGVSPLTPEERFQRKPYNKATVKRMHHDEDMTVHEIANHFDVNNKSVRYWLDVFDIRFRRAEEIRENEPEHDE